MANFPRNSSTRKVREILEAVLIVSKYFLYQFVYSGDLLHIGNLKPWNLYSVLTEKYNWPPLDAELFADFLTPMLNYDKRQRATAEECLKHPWVQTKRESENYADILNHLKNNKPQNALSPKKPNSTAELAKNLQTSNLLKYLPTAKD